MPVPDQARGYVFGSIGVFIFALTLPLTRIAVAEFNPFFLSIGRTVGAAALAIPLLIFTRQTCPTRDQILSLVLTAVGVVLGFPVFSAIAMQSAPASHGGVVLGALPLATAVMGTFSQAKSRPPFSGFGVLLHPWRSLPLPCGMAVPRFTARTASWFWPSSAPAWDMLSAENSHAPWAAGKSFAGYLFSHCLSHCLSRSISLQPSHGMNHQMLGRALPIWQS